MNSCKSKSIPLCVDLDGTLIKTDLLFESLILFLKHRWWHLFLLPFWLLKGKSWFKSKLAQQVDIRIDRLPFHHEFLNYLSEQNQKGRKLVLVTGSNIKYANEISDFLGIFDDVFASTESFNCSNTNKAEKLVKIYGKNGFDYAGNSSSDLPVWKMSRRSILVTPSKSTFIQAKKMSEIETIFRRKKNNLQEYFKALRVHQWIKNFLIFVPLLTAHKIDETSALINAIFAFLAMGFCASAAYIINDLLDLETDRGHQTKCMRMFASGTIPIYKGIVFIPFLLLISFSSFAILPYKFATVLLIYLLITLLYSYWLKRIQTLDIIVLALLYTLRVIAGAVAINVEISFWLLAFSMFLFVSLALVKRVSELQTLELQKSNSIDGRAYNIVDITALKMSGTSSGYMAILVLAFYINSPEVKIHYHTPEFLWLLCPIMTYWITRVWLLCGRGKIGEDPISFAVSDKQSWFAGFLTVGVLLIATFYSSINFIWL
ncbi:UbiA family prenyltransferase [Aliikangiella sp. IMCC44359]|uniref:UbiA family prenyltransferase n=1 Tax=Aliikangiella sp. IMCC44359 TaxID=3459125 RepID=UPI00403B0885